MIVDQPTTSPTITQTPDRPIIDGSKVTLTCTIEGGNPVATITWSCDGVTQITPTGSPEDAITSVELVTSKNNNGQICICTGTHILWTNNKTQQHTITVYCKYRLYCNWVSRMYPIDGVFKPYCAYGNMNEKIYAPLQSNSFKV